jgi:hypothetical protein
VAELVLGSAPAATLGVVDGAARDRRLRKPAGTPSAALARLNATPTAVGLVTGAELPAAVKPSAIRKATGMGHTRRQVLEVHETSQ